MQSQRKRSLLKTLTWRILATSDTFLISYLIRSDKNEKLIFSIIIGGAIGNFYDRLVYKAVPDFIDIHFANFHWFTFNVADIFITIGILIFILRSFFVKN